jgi:amidase
LLIVDRLPTLTHADNRCSLSRLINQNRTDRMDPQDANNGMMATLDLVGETDGPLAGLNAVIKDVFDVGGTVTSFGNATWARLHPPALVDAPIVSRLREAGARIVGKTITVEFTFGLEGQNQWYGTPLNPAAPDRLPGGSSSGSASAVASGLAAIGIGSDTGGSVRIPASYCGLFGLRPSYGLLSLAGAARYVPSLDVAGWFARDAATMQRVGDALLPANLKLNGDVIMVRDAFDNANPDVAAAIGAVCDRIEAAGHARRDVTIWPQGLDDLLVTQSLIHGWEAWQSLGPWVELHKPAMAEITANRLRGASKISLAEVRGARRNREAFRAHVLALLADGAVLALPSSPCIAPRRDADRATLDAVRQRTLKVTAIAGLAGLPELSIPAGISEGCPVGLSLIAAPGRDRSLLAMARRLADGGTIRR